MLITSSFHDYYDTAATYGIDRRTVYRRESRNIQFNTTLQRLLSNYRTHSLYYFNLAVVGVAGVLYPLVFVTNSQNADVFYFYSFKELEAFLNKIGENKKDFLSKHRTQKLKAHFELKNTSLLRHDINLQVFSQIFTDYKVPIFIVTSEGVELNPNLEKLKFGRIMPATTIFQAIQAFLENLRAKIDVPVQISDKIKAQQRGFDPKYGFRKRPNK